MYTAAATSEALLAESPELREEFIECEGLLHLQLAALARRTEAAILSGDLTTVRRDLMFVDRILAGADEFVDNAIHVSYLEHVEFAGDHAESAKALLSSRLREGWRSIQDYMGSVAEISRTGALGKSPRHRSRKRR
jgi:hypothetical protein